MWRPHSKPIRPARASWLAPIRREQYSIRINQQWRICFRWCEGAAQDVAIVDYHG
jgi:proteic killer suppression protein